MTDDDIDAAEPSTGAPPVDAPALAEAGHAQPGGEAQTSFDRTHAARRRWRRRLALLMTGVFALGWLGFGATFYRHTFERKQQDRVHKALAAGEFSGIVPVADGRTIRLEGSVATQQDAEAAAALAQRVRYVKGKVDISRLQVGGGVGRILPLTATYAEGKLTFEGTRPSATAVAALVKAAGAGLGADNVAVQFAAEAGEGGDDKAYSALGAAFARFPAIGVRSATVAVTEVDASVTGRVADDRGRSELVQTLSSATSRSVKDNLELDAGTAATSVSESSSVGTTASESATTIAGAATTDPGSSSTVAGAPSTVAPSTQAGLPASTLAPADRATLQAELDTTLKANRIEFTTDSAALGARAKAIIADLASRLAPTGVAFEVGGHTDSRGRSDRNLALSQRRADAVRQAFIDAGIRGDLVTAVGYGSQKLVARDVDIHGNPLNRRIEITLK